MNWVSNRGLLLCQHHSTWKSCLLKSVPRECAT
jgi:hypothetical protein